MANRTLKMRIAALALLFIAAQAARLSVAEAQDFAVKQFRQLPNDVSAFIDPVRDLNDEPCALIKVAAPEEFAFSSPLGIVVRRDEVGEIWLYMPRGSKMLTIKHPRWGVLRDYRFPQPLESHVTYELTLDLPRQDDTLRTDTIILTQTIVDTVTIGRRKPRLPMAASALLTASFHDNGPSWGIMAVAMRRHGAFVHAQTDFRHTGPTNAECNEEGLIGNSGVMPYYTGATRHSSYAVTAGPIHRLWPGINLFYGAGYGRTATAWQLAESEGGGYALNSGLTHSGVAAEAGVMVRLGRICLSASAITIAGKAWQGSVGIGIRLYKSHK